MVGSMPRVSFCVTRELKKNAYIVGGMTVAGVVSATATDPTLYTPVNSFIYKISDSHVALNEPQPAFRKIIGFASVSEFFFPPQAELVRRNGLRFVSGFCFNFIPATPSTYLRSLLDLFRIAWLVRVHKHPRNYAKRRLSF